MILGFTGTSRGLTQRQKESLCQLVNELKPTEIHHGDCIGADFFIHALCLERPIRIVIHSPIKDKARAFCSGAHESRPPRPYLKRNIEIVREGRDGLIAVPAGTELLRSGTWSTVRYARKLNRHIWIVWPSGLISEENS